MNEVECGSEDHTKCLSISSMLSVCEVWKNKFYLSFDEYYAPVVLTIR
jgi:hypothetical protein